MKTRIKDIANRAGVSTGTVDRVIHDRGEVSAKTREKVKAILNETQYKPDILASTLASREALKVAVLIPFHSDENGFWKEPLSGLNDAISELSHFRMEIREFLFSQFDKQDYINKSEAVLSYCPDAVIAAPVFYKETRDFFENCSTMGIPVTSINDNLDHPAQITYIGQDSKKSGEVAAHLLKLGIPEKSEVLIVSIAKDKDNYRHILHREEGFRKYWQNDDGASRTRILFHAIPDDNYEYIRDNLSEHFKNYAAITGIFVTNSRVYQVARYLKEINRKDISLIGYDLINPNIEYLKEGVIDFLISQKPREQGYRALMTIFNKIKLNKKPIPEQLIPIDIVCKENLSCYQD